MVLSKEVGPMQILAPVLVEIDLATFFFPSIGHFEYVVCDRERELIFSVLVGMDRRFVSVLPPALGRILGSGG